MADDGAELADELEEEPVQETAEQAAAGAKKKKKSKKKRKKGGAAGGEADEEGGAAADMMSSIQVAINSISNYQTEVEDSKESHRFWDTQPVPTFKEGKISAESMGPIEPVDKVIPPDPYKLPAGFEWAPCDVSNPAEMDDIYQLLNENYVEDDDNLFRFDYSIEFLRWALMPPGYHKDWHVCVRYKQKLVGFITGIPATMMVYGRPVKSTEINFLCVHKKWRSKRLAPVLIKEVTRRVNLRGVFQAVYTAGVVLPRPVARARYYHRSLNPKKLIDVGFSRLAPRMTMARTLKLYKLPDQHTITGIRPMEPRDVPVVTKLLHNYLSKFMLYPEITEDDLRHWFLPREGVISCFVVEDARKQITDMFSFYSLPSSILNNKEHPTLRAAYSYYTVPGQHSLMTLMNEALIVAKLMNFDVFNALDILDNRDVLTELKFGIGDGHLQYYLYNWRCPDMPPHAVGLVLL